MSHFGKSYEEVCDKSLIPEETDTYKPMPNKYLIDEVYNRVREEGFKVEGRQFAMNRSGTNLFAVFSIEADIDDYSTMIGAVNSYDKTRAVGVATGARVHKCSNLSFSDFKQVRKHTKNLFDDFHDILNKMVRSLKTDAVELIQEEEKLKEVPLDDNAIPHLLGELFYKEEMINTTQLNLIKKNMKKVEQLPPEELDDNLFGKNNYFDFLMHCTEALKKSHPKNIVQDHMAVENWVKQRANQVATSQPISVN